jgi:hypothetical protein
VEARRLCSKSLLEGMESPRDLANPLGRSETRFYIQTRQSWAFPRFPGGSRYGNYGPPQTLSSNAYFIALPPGWTDSALAVQTFN